MRSSSWSCLTAIIVSQGLLELQQPYRDNRTCVFHLARIACSSTERYSRANNRAIAT